ncbi:ATP-binding protein [Chryseobacterium sp.]|uniref:sensor histidine kinase n=1 Tax=Chryseobacterium sp. TaxID=1871047 RepID=UPI0025BC333E|nr:ATP-binding protein [Chryseobacterium sp.]
MENQNSVIGWIWAGLSILFLITLCIIILVIHHQENIKKNKHKIIQLVRNAQTGCLEEAFFLQEKERERLAEELHDNILSRLNLIRLNTDIKSSHEINTDLKKSMQLIRELSHNLTPPDLMEIELADLIGDYLEQVNRSIEIIYLHYGLKESNLSSEVKLNLFRIVQELITNILKHANATSINILLRISLKYVILIVEDNGCGFSSNGSYRGIGIQNIQSRIRQIRAVYKLKTNPAKGTKYIICTSAKSKQKL